MTETERLLAEADSFGERQVIRHVAHRAGLLWVCGCCRADNFGCGMACARCAVPAPDEDQQHFRRSNLVRRVSDR